MNTAQKTPMKFVLVRWLSDETVGVMPLSCLRHKDVAHFWQCRDDEQEQDAVQGCSPKGPGVGSRNKGNSQ